MGNEMSPEFVCASMKSPHINRRKLKLSTVLLASCATQNSSFIRSELVYIRKEKGSEKANQIGIAHSLRIHQQTPN
jgi:hypothetical protein